METETKHIPVIPIRNAVFYPGVSMPLLIGRSKSIHALENAQKHSEPVLIVTQRNTTLEVPTGRDLYQVGVLSKIESVVRAESGTLQAVFTGISRFRAHTYADALYFWAAAGEVEESDESGLGVPQLLEDLKDRCSVVLRRLPGVTEPLLRLVDRVEDADYLSNIVAAYTNIPLAEKQALLETLDVEIRLERLVDILDGELLRGLMKSELERVGFRVL